MSDSRYRPTHRLRKRAEFEQVKRRGRRVPAGCFFAQGYVNAEAPASEPRLGVIVTKRLGNAVKRNRAKRVCRELFRLHRDALPERCELVIIPRPSFFKQPPAVLEKQFLRTCSRLKENKK